jgi:hypothetical protein
LPSLSCLVPAILGWTSSLPWVNRQWPPMVGYTGSMVKKYPKFLSLYFYTLLL